MSEGGHFNRAARRSGGNPALVLAAGLASIGQNHAKMLSCALKVHKVSKYSEIPVADVIAKAREIGYIDCDDTQAKWLEDFLTKDDFNPSQL